MCDIFVKMMCALRHDNGRRAVYRYQTMTCRLLLLLSLWLAAMMPAHAELPFGWELFTSTPRLFAAGKDPLASSGRFSGRLLGAPQARIDQYAVLSQKISAVDYRGARVRLSAKLRLEGVAGRAGLWLRADGAGGEPLAFDNMDDRPLRGEHDWHTVTIELNVPAQSQELHFGLLLCGSGQARIDDLKLSRAGPTTAPAQVRAKVRSLPRAPFNGDFER